MAASIPASSEMQECIDNCLSCHATCEATLRYCLSNDALAADRSQLLLLLDCAEICHTSAGFLLRNSDLHHDTCRTCARVCTQCADWCDRLQRDPVLKQCARTCRACATSCEEMARH